MALRWAESYRLAVDTASLTSRYDASSGFTWQATGGRTPGPCGEFAGSAAGYAAHLHNNTAGQGSIAAWFTFPSAPSSAVILFEFTSASASSRVTNLCLALGTDMVLRLYRGTPGAGTLLGTSTVGALPTGTPIHLSWAFVMGATGSSSTQRDGVAETGLTIASTETRIVTTETSFITSYVIWGWRAGSPGFSANVSVGANVRFVQSGSFNNGHISNSEVVCCRPTATGTYDQFTPVGDTTSWQCTNETPHDSDATYMESVGTTLRKSTFIVQNVPSNVTQVYGVVGTIVMRNQNTGTSAVTGAAMTMRSAGTDGNAAGFTLPGATLDRSYARYTSSYDRPPGFVGVGAYGPSTFNACEHGVVLTLNLAAATYARVTQFGVEALVPYPPAPTRHIYSITRSGRYRG